MRGRGRELACEHIPGHSCACCDVWHRAQTREVVDAMRADSGCELALLHADGGASRNGLLMQLQADALQVRIMQHVALL